MDFKILKNEKIKETIAWDFLDSDDSGDNANFNDKTNFDLCACVSECENVLCVCVYSSIEKGLKCFEVDVIMINHDEIVRVLLEIWVCRPTVE